MSKDQFDDYGDLVYHYTDQFGLVGIIERRELWATNISYLNDASEVAYGLEFFRNHNGECIQVLKNSLQIDDRFSSSFEKVFEYLISQADARHFLKDPKEYLYVSSFFESASLRKVTISGIDAGDNLEQWRAYSKGGVGYSIGFDKKLLTSQVAKQTGADLYTYCGSCIYSKEEKTARVRETLEILEPACDIAMHTAYGDWAEKQHAVICMDGSVTPPGASTELRRGEDKPKDREAISSALQWYWGRKMISTSFMKHEAFAMEHEWRIVRLAFTNSEQIQFKTRKDGIVPYSAVSIADDKSPEHLVPGIIRRIVAGPLGDASFSKRQRDVRSVKMLLEHNGVEVKSEGHENGVIIESSELPC